MCSKKWINLLLACLAGFIFALPVWAAYNHNGDTDSVNFRSAYPDKVGTKLDSCTLCHKGGTYHDSSTNKDVTVGSCQYCHGVTNYGSDTTKFAQTLNSFGQAYKDAGRNKAAFAAIETVDSDGDGYTNLAEINALRYPGDAADDPSKVPAPYRVFTKAQLQAMPQHSQFLLMNTTKSGDYYATYSGVILQDLLQTAGIRSGSTKIDAYAADGYSISHPLDDSASNTGSSYAPFVNGAYPVATYYYNSVADKANGGWVDYSSPGTAGRVDGETITVDGGLRLILALQAEGVDLVPGYIDGTTNKLANGTEGPFRTITPQKIVGPPDRASTDANKNSQPYPYSSANDHNAGYSTKCATMIKVYPLPAGTTDIDAREAGWNYVDQGKIVVYGNINPLPNIYDKIDQLSAKIQAAPATSFYQPLQQKALLQQIAAARALITKGSYSLAVVQLQRNMLTTDGCVTTTSPDSNDWVTNCDFQKTLYYSLNEIVVLLKMLV